jgi:hypothetical protein
MDCGMGVFNEGTRLRDTVISKNDSNGDAHQEWHGPMFESQRSLLRISDPTWSNVLRLQPASLV